LLRFGKSVAFVLLRYVHCHDTPNRKSSDLQDFSQLFSPSAATCRRQSVTFRAKPICSTGISTCSSSPATSCFHLPCT